MTDKPKIIAIDPWLEPFQGTIVQRLNRARVKARELSPNLEDFANGYLYYGLHKREDSWIFREWAPNASSVHLVGDFSDWKVDERFRLRSTANGNWELVVPLDKIKHLDLYRLSIQWKGGQGDRIPAWARRVVQDEKSLIYNAQVWEPDQPYKWRSEFSRQPDVPPMVYEAHIGMATEEEKIGTYNEFREKVLPWIIEAGYNTIQLMAIQEHPYYGSFGYHVSSFFAPSSHGNGH